MDFVKANESAIKREYIKKDLTARKVAERMNVTHNKYWVKALYQHFGPKGKGWGGARPGSGNKKGIQFCGRCRKTIEQCICR